MSALVFSPERRLRRVLAIGAHPDDIELGCGGTVLLLRGRDDAIEFHWVVLCATGERRDEARAGARRFAGEGVHLLLSDFRDAYLPYDAIHVKEYFERQLKPLEPDLVLTHHGLDGHQDHRLVSELTWSTFRNHMILEYEIPKYDGDLGRPSVFVPLPSDVAERKWDALLDVYRSQREKRWFERSTFEAIARLRGVEAGGDAVYAEAFYSRKLRVSW